MSKMLFILVMTGILLGGLDLRAISEAAVSPVIESAAISPSGSEITQPVTAQKQQDEKMVRQMTLVLYGMASWYSEKDPFINFRTANNEVFDDSKLTCASWDFPFNTYVKVTNLANGKSITCRINDRGPVKRLKRLIDLTKETFSRIASPKAGLIEVSVTPLSIPLDSVKRLKKKK